MPIVSGNVSLYNETDGAGILPTPTIGAVGLIQHPDDIIGNEVRDGHVALVIGETHGHLGQSALLQEVFGRSDGDAPPVDLDAEAKHGQFVRDNRHLITACTDISDGGLALAAFELAEASGVGLALDNSETPFLFGEDQARYLVACNFDKAEALMLEAGKIGIPIHAVGKFTGDTVWLGNASAPLSELSDIYRSTFGATFA